MLMQHKCWFTADEIADLSLAGLPRSKRAVNRLAKDERWQVAIDGKGVPLARRRSGHGGGYEYHASLLPAAARADLVRLGVTGRVDLDTSAAADSDDACAQWHWLARQPEAVREEAQRRLTAVNRVELFEAADMSRSAAVTAVAAADQISPKTLWNWLGMIKGVPASDRLPHLAPRRQGGGIEADIDPDIWEALLSDYLQQSEPGWAVCYRRTAMPLAKAAGIDLPHQRTLWRKFEREVPAQVVTLRRKGEEALRRMLPAQIRSVKELHALELVNIDGHRCDVFVRWPDGRILRPTLIAIQDVYSRKFLAWRIAETEDMVTARLVFADLFATWGIPKGLLADNGRAFASKWLTGASRTRFRGKILDSDPTGLLVALGINIHWAKPYRGQSKPIERGFRDLVAGIATLKAFEGAYTGSNPTAKPENYGSAAIDLDTFKAIWDAGMHAHNAQQGRRSEMAGGRLSFDQVFEESYVRAPIGKATEEQLRMALLAAEQVKVDRITSSITLAGNRYWSPELVDLIGQRVTVRFDPDRLHQPIHVYDQMGRFVITVPLWEANGFLDMGAAKKRQRLERDWKKKTKAASEAFGRLSADELLARLPQYDDEPEAPAPGAVRLVRHRGNTAAALKPVSQAAEQPLRTPAGEATIDRMARAAERRLRAVD